MAIETTNYGGKNVTAMQITTSLYPTTSDPVDTHDGEPLDIRERVHTPDVLTSSTPVGCRLYAGLHIYVESTKETVTVLGRISGADGSVWNHWVFSKITDDFKTAVDRCHDGDTQGRYSEIKSGDYSTENLLNYLFVRDSSTVSTKHRLTILYVSEGGGQVAPAYTADLSEGSQYSVTSPVGVTGMRPETAVVTGTMGSVDVNYTVTYLYNDYTLTYLLDPGGEEWETETLHYNDLVEEPEVPSRPGYMFNGWTYSPSLYNQNYMPAANVTATANWVSGYTEVAISTSSSPAQGGTTTGSGIYHSGAEVTVTASANQNYSFYRWTEGGSQVSTNASYTFTAESDRTLVANFTQQTYDVEVRSVTTPSGTGGTVSGGGTGIPSGSTRTVTATPKSEYAFTGWYDSAGGGDLVSENPSYSFPVTENVELWAYFIKTYRVTANPSPSTYGSITGNSVTYQYGDTVALTAVPNSGYKFVRWTESASTVSTDPVMTFTANANRTLTAVFEPVANVNVFAKIVTSSVAQQDLPNIDFGTMSYYTTAETDTDSSYYVYVPQNSFGTPTSTKYVIAAIPSNFVHGTPAGNSGDFFKIEGTMVAEDFPDFAHAEHVIHNGVDYLVVESSMLDVSPDSGSSYEILFGNVGNGLWRQECAVAHTVIAAPSA